MKRSTMLQHRLLMMMTVTLMVRGAVAEECWSDVDLSMCAAAAEEDVQPAAECCANLQEYTSAGPAPEVCLCGAVSYAVISELDNEKFNLWYTLQIPSKCNLHFPAGTSCLGYQIPGGQ